MIKTIGVINTMPTVPPDHQVNHVYQKGNPFIIDNVAELIVALMHGLIVALIMKKAMISLGFSKVGR